MREYLLAIEVDTIDESPGQGAIYVEVSGDYALILQENNRFNLLGIGSEYEIVGVLDINLENISHPLEGEYVYIEDNSNNELIGFPDVIKLINDLK